MMSIRQKKVKILFLSPKITEKNRLHLTQLTRKPLTYFSWDSGLSRFMGCNLIIVAKRCASKN